MGCQYKRAEVILKRYLQICSPNTSSTPCETDNILVINFLRAQFALHFEVQLLIAREQWGHRKQCDDYNSNAGCTSDLMKEIKFQFPNNT